jgi:hypothetical protein
LDAGEGWERPRRRDFAWDALLWLIPYWGWVDLGAGLECGPHTDRTRSAEGTAHAKPAISLGEG